jgi:hypothetical protein
MEDSLPNNPSVIQVVLLFKNSVRYGNRTYVKVNTESGFPRVRSTRTCPIQKKTFWYRRKLHGSSVASVLAPFGSFVPGP